tara:strand:+ start:66 stop:521 length:456 start_codon:yes stop_codon:yes gene_type:complete
MDNSIKRVMKDIKMLRKTDIEIHEVIDAQNIVCIFPGPKDTPYENGKWKISISFPKNYPFNSPSVGFIDKIYHPNVDYASGSICLNVLNDEWQPIYTLRHITETFLPQLLTYPNPDDPMNIDAANLFKKNNKQFIRQVKSNIYSNSLNKCV